MDKEIIYINNILVNSVEGLSTSDISKKIFEKYGAKVSRTIVKNYLWSYFRNLIKYDSSEFTYKLDSSKFLIDDINVIETENAARPITANFIGSNIKVEYDNKIPIDTYIQAIAIINFKSGRNNKNVDLLKQLNRIVEQITLHND